jgi:hypothetical protein
MAMTHATGKLSQNPLANILAYQFAWFACICNYSAHQNAGCSDFSGFTTSKTQAKRGVFDQLS